MNRSYGSKYVKGLDVVEIAKRVRADIKEACKAGTLPAGKYSVRIDRYSMGRSIDIGFKVTDPTFVVHNPKRLRFDHDNPHGNMHDAGDPELLWRYSVPMRELMDTLEAILAAYNHDGSDMMTDYYDVNFAAHVTADWKWEAERKEVELATLFGLTG